MRSKLQLPNFVICLPRRQTGWEDKEWQNMEKLAMGFENSGRIGIEICLKFNYH